MFRALTNLRPVISRLASHTLAAAPAPVATKAPAAMLCTPASMSLRQSAGMKTRSSVKKYCPHCYIVRRKGRVYVYCKSNGKHKQRQA